MARGWWRLSIEMWDDDSSAAPRPNDVTLEHIAECVANGFVEGEIVQDDEEGEDE